MYTVTDALAETVLLEKRILGAISTAVFDSISREKIVSPKVKTDTDKLINDIKDGYKSLKALIKRRHQIKAAIIKSNAGVPKGQALINLITVDGVEYTPAELIERKRALHIEKKLLDKLESYNNLMERRMVEENKTYTAKLDTFIANYIESQDPSKKKTDPDVVEHCTRAFSPTNQPVRLDPIGLVDEILTFRTYIEDFESKLDRELSKYNATTELEF